MDSEPAVSRIAAINTAAGARMPQVSEARCAVPGAPLATILDVACLAGRARQRPARGDANVRGYSNVVLQFGGEQQRFGPVSIIAKFGAGFHDYRNLVQAVRPRDFDLIM